MTTTTLTIKAPPVLENAVWSVNSAVPGDRVTLSVTVKEFDAARHVLAFHLYGNDMDEGCLKVFKLPDSTTPAGWIVTTTPGSTARFKTVQPENPSPKNGFRTVVTEVLSGPLTINGCTLEIKDHNAGTDTCFVPKQEKLQVSYDFNGPVPAMGRIEVWG